MGSSNSNAAEATPAPTLAPISGATLFTQESARRKSLHRKGAIPTGCPEIDDALLLGGGFERGCVVGVSAEDVDFGVLLGLQTIARGLVFEGSSDRSLPPSRGNSERKAAIITTLPATTILPILRGVIRSQVQSKLGPRNPGVDAELRRTLEAISISRIFDIEGLWEVLRELGEPEAETSMHHDQDASEEMPGRRVPAADQDEEPVPVPVPVYEGEGATRSPTREKMEVPAKAEVEKTEIEYPDFIPSGASSKPTASLPERITELPPLRIRSQLQPLVRKSEILDSEDEEPFSSSPLSSPPPSTVARESVSPPQEHPQSPANADSEHAPSATPGPGEAPVESEAPSSPPQPESPPGPAAIPDMILVTHFSSLLTTLFTHADKTTAHTRLQLLASYMHRLTRSADPLIMLVNSTTSPSPAADASTSTSATPGPGPGPGPPHPPLDPRGTRHQRPLDPTLRSIFNPGPQLQLRGGTGYDHGYGYGHRYPYGAATTTRRNKPSFGATFAQFLDLHLLCTAVPRARDDAEVAVALGGGAGAGDVRYAWVVEVLLDELGFWAWGTGKEKGKESGKGIGKESSGSARLPTRVNREQRWAAVDVRDHVRVVDAFATDAGAGGGTGGGSGSVRRGLVRLAAGFGGPRV